MTPLEKRALREVDDQTFIALTALNAVPRKGQEGITQVIAAIDALKRASLIICDIQDSQK